MEEKQLIKILRNKFKNNELLEVEFAGIFVFFKVGLKKALCVPEGLHGDIIFNGMCREIHLAIKKEILEKLE